MTLPRERGTRINSTNVQQRLNRELKRRTDEAQVSPMDDAALRLSDAILFAVSDEEDVDARRFLSQASLQKLCDPAGATRRVRPGGCDPAGVTRRPRPAAG